MLDNKQVLLFTTLGCHLCDQAHGMVNYLLENESERLQNVHLKLIEITEDDGLVERYGVRIPVLKFGNSELSWPFEIEELHSWLLT